MKRKLVATFMMQVVTSKWQSNIGIHSLWYWSLSNITVHACIFSISILFTSSSYNLPITKSGKFYGQKMLPSSLLSPPGTIATDMCQTSFLSTNLILFQPFFLDMADWQSWKTNLTILLPSHTCPRTPPQCKDRVISLIEVQIFCNPILCHIYSSNDSNESPCPLIIYSVSSAFSFQLPWESISGCQVSHWAVTSDSVILQGEANSFSSILSEDAMISSMVISNFSIRLFGWRF